MFRVNFFEKARALQPRPPPFAGRHCLWCLATVVQKKRIGLLRYEACFCQYRTEEERRQALDRAYHTGEKRLVVFTSKFVDNIARDDDTAWVDPWCLP